ncbi:hypothetical protein [Limisalsivibrio acetivorans]|uniref:hypothetical protein n=1 Tax=Limisalsivibrio acetivorans TaxID=1304888 RepID=UPI0003B4F8E2|nr:hypothetical protein [Limisalsivibrio acetivorans]
MKRTIIILLGSLLLAVGAFASGHSYITGNVQDQGRNTLQVGGVTYSVDEKALIVKVSNKDGRFEEKVISLRNVDRGDSVRLKVIGKIVYEIAVEDY